MDLFLDSRTYQLIIKCQVLKANHHSVLLCIFLCIFSNIVKTEKIQYILRYFL